MAVRFADNLWHSIASYAKQQLQAKYDPTRVVASGADLAARLEVAHKGFYLAVESSTGKSVSRVGFLEEDQADMLKSLHRVVDAAYQELQGKSIPVQMVNTGRIHLTAVLDLVFIANGLNWNENEDGVYFSWGDRYKGLYLPYQIQKMTVPKSEIMNRLCSWEAEVPSNLWRLPCGLVHKLICDSYSL